MGKDITITCADGEFGAYLALPASGSGPGVVAIQEIFGINADMRTKCDELAGQGFVAMAPDLFWRQEPGIQLTDKTDEEWARAFELFNGFDAEKGIMDIQDTIVSLRQLDACTGKVGAVGYCLGGMLAYLTSCNTDIDASVGYYGVNINNLLDQSNGISKPLMLHIATNDEFVDAEAQKAMHEGLDNNPQVTLYDYDGLDHAFARKDGVHYNAEAANLANGRTLDFLKLNLDQ